MCIRNEEMCITNEEMCIKNEEMCIKNEEMCIENEEFCRSGLVGVPEDQADRVLDEVMDMRMLLCIYMPGD